MSEAAPMTRRELEAKITRKAWTDETFRAELLADPVATFVKYTGVPAAQLPRISVHEEAPGSWHIVLPAKPVARGELSDDELEKVAGGTDVVVVTIVASIVSYVATVSVMANTLKEQGW